MTHAAMMAVGNDEVNTYESAAVLMVAKIKTRAPTACWWS